MKPPFKPSAAEVAARQRKRRDCRRATLIAGLVARCVMTRGFRVRMMERVTDSQDRLLLTQFLDRKF